MVQSTKASGPIAKRTAEEDLFMQMAIFTRENGKMIKQMVLEYIDILMAPDMKDTGMTIDNMDKESKHGLTVLNTKVITKWEKSMAWVNSNGQMALPILETSIITTLKDQELMNGVTVVGT
jgi:hypothetical protein